MTEKKIILNVNYRLPHGNFSLFLQEIQSLILESEPKKLNFALGAKIFVFEI